MLVEFSSLKTEFTVEIVIKLSSKNSGMEFAVSFHNSYKDYKFFKILLQKYLPP